MTDDDDEIGSCEQILSHDRQESTQFQIRMKKKTSYGSILPDPLEEVIALNDESDEDGLTSISLDKWQGERTSLLERTSKEASRLGAKTGLSKKTTPLLSNLSSKSEEENEDQWTWQRKLKVSLMVLLALAMVIILLFFPEEVTNSYIIEVSRGKPFILDLAEMHETNRQQMDNYVLVSITGHFVPEEVTFLAKDQLNVSIHKDLPLENKTSMQVWNVGLLDSESGFMEQISLTHMFDMHTIFWKEEDVSLVLETEANFSSPIVLRVQLLSNLANIGISLGAIVLVIMYALILLDILHRTIVTMFAATAVISLLALLDERPSLESILTWIDTETLTLLFSMMIIVSVLTETGIFNVIGVLAFRLTRGRIWPLIGVLCTLTAVVSAVLDNVTTILLMTPVIIQLCEEMHIDPTLILIANVIFSNIGGASTAIGDPPNVLIASDKDFQNAGIGFANFTLHMSLCVIFVAIVDFCILRLLYGKMDVQNESQEVRELMHEILIWKRTANNMSSVSREESIVRDAIEMKIEELKAELIEKRFVAHQVGMKSHIQDFGNEHKIKNKGLLIKSSIVLVVTVILFFLSNFPQFNLSLGWTSLLGAMILLILADYPDLESIFMRVEWGTLIFFASLFVVMEGLDKLGLLKAIGNLVESAIKGVPESWQLTAALMLILWVSGLASGFIDNIPFTTMMIPVVKSLSESNQLALPLQPLVFALALGACLGGNGTLIGASANIVCAGVAEQHGYRFSFMQFFKIGFPISIVSLLVASAYLLICHVAIKWNGV